MASDSDTDSDTFNPPCSVEEIFEDFTARRTALIQALTSDVDLFLSLCDPEKDNLCLYGYPNEIWDVAVPPSKVPTNLPEPTLGINFARDGMNRKDWLSLVAVHSDCWLISVAFFFGASLNKNDRKHLFNLINDLPNVFEVVTGRYPIKVEPTTDIKVEPTTDIKVEPTTDIKVEPTTGIKVEPTTDMKVEPTMNSNFVAERKPIKVEPTTDSGSKSRSLKKSNEGQSRSKANLLDESNEEYVDKNEYGETPCGSCGGDYNSDEFWICCDICENWFHGRCVKITPSKAKNMKQYNCPSCKPQRVRRTRQL